MQDEVYNNNKKKLENKKYQFTRELRGIAIDSIHFKRKENGGDMMAIMNSKTATNFTQKKNKIIKKLFQITINSFSSHYTQYFIDEKCKYNCAIFFLFNQANPHFKYIKKIPLYSRRCILDKKKNV